MTGENVFDVILIGAGPAGEIAAARAVRAGITTAVVERRWAEGELAACAAAFIVLSSGDTGT